MSRLSQAIAEGDGISILVEVVDGASAGSAEEQGADGLVVRAGSAAAVPAVSLPLLYIGEAADARGAAADAVVVPADLGAWDEARGFGLECVVRVANAEDLEHALEELDPEVLLLTVEPGNDDDPLEALLALLHDVPAGKLAIAELRDATAEDAEELERAGVDAVLVSARDVAALVSSEPPEV